jgi:hypothetical protein
MKPARKNTLNGRLHCLHAILGSMLLSLLGCGTSHEDLSLYAIRPGAEDDVEIFKLTLNQGSHVVGDTLYFLSPLIDTLKHEDYSQGADLSAIFLQHQSHPILLTASQFLGDSVRFQSEWFGLSSTDSVMFDFEGHVQDGSILGRLVSLAYVSSLNRTIPDTALVKFHTADMRDQN